MTPCRCFHPFTVDGFDDAERLTHTHTHISFLPGPQSAMFFFSGADGSCPARVVMRCPCVCVYTAPIYTRQVKSTVYAQHSITGFANRPCSTATSTFHSKEGKTPFERDISSAFF